MPKTMPKSIKGKKVVKISGIEEKLDEQKDEIMFRIKIASNPEYKDPLSKDYIRKHNNTCSGSGLISNSMG